MTGKRRICVVWRLRYRNNNDDDDDENYFSSLYNDDDDHQFQWKKTEDFPLKSIKTNCIQSMIVGTHSTILKKKLAPIWLWMMMMSVVVETENSHHKTGKKIDFIIASFFYLL